MGSCDFRWARKWGWPTIELHCTETCKHLSFSPPYSHCTTRLIILKLVHVHNHRLANTNNIFSVTAPFLGFDLLFTSRSYMPAVSYANAERWEPLKECIHWCGRSQWVLWLRIWEWLLSAHSGNISKQGSFEWCRDKSSHARLLVFFTTEWPWSEWSIISFEGWKKPLKWTKCNVGVQYVWKGSQK